MEAADPADRNNLDYQCQACPDGTFTDEMVATACKASGAARERYLAFIH